MAENAPEHHPGRGRWAVRWLFVSGGGCVVAQLLEPVVNAAAQHPSHVTPWSLAASLAAMLGAASWLIGWFASAITVVVWEYRTIRTMAGLDRAISLAPAEAVVWWFVPIANLWKPYAVVRELASLVAPRVTRVAALWWTAYLLMIASTSLAQGHGPFGHAARWATAATTLAAATLLVHVMRSIQEGVDRAVLRRRALIREQAARASTARAAR